MKKACPECGNAFDPADRALAGAQAGAVAQIKYCSEICARKAENRRYYQTNKASTIRRTKQNRRLRRLKKK
jgi:hypothetical protein